MREEGAVIIAGALADPVAAAVEADEWCQDDVGFEFGGEADPSPFARAAVDAGCIIALPHVVRRSLPMRFLSWATEAALIAGPFGLHQPAEDAAELEPDIILTPLVGFDRSGNRIGQGAGYYDRAFLAHPNAWRVGVALSVQEVETLTPDPWDVPLHAIATESDWITP